MATQLAESESITQAERLIPFLYSLDARAASERLIALGTASLDPLLRVLRGEYPLPNLTKVEAVEIDGVLLTCVGGDTGANVDAARERAAYILGDIGDARAVDTLIAAYARETERHAKLAMVRALGQIGDARAVDTLIAALAAPAWTPHYRYLVDDLSRLGGARAVDPLIRHLQREAYSYGSAAQAARALLSRKDDPRVLDGLIGALRVDAEFSTLEAVIAALAQIGGAKAAQALLKLVSAMLALPPERWDDREDNLSETDQGVIFHVLKTEFRDSVRAIRHINHAETTAALEQALASAAAWVMPPQ